MSQREREAHQHLQGLYRFLESGCIDPFQIDFVKMSIVQLESDLFGNEKRRRAGRQFN